MAEPIDNENDPSAETLLQDFLKDAQLQGMADKTVATYRSDLQAFLDWLGDDPTDIDYDDLRGFLYHLKNEREARDGSTGLADSTLNTYFSALNSFYKFLSFEGYVDENLVPAFRDRYLDLDQAGTAAERQLISVEEMAMLIHATLKVRDRALIMLLAKTGIRRDECVQLDVDDIDWETQSLRLANKPKRSRTTVFFDGECARLLQRWLDARAEVDPDTDALFLNQVDTRLQENGIYNAVTNRAEAVDLHDPESQDPQERFTPHCCRHWFTTHLRRSGMQREFIKALRGDTRGEAIDIYDHIDERELREAYLAHIPTLGL